MVEVIKRANLLLVVQSLCVLLCTGLVSAVSVRSYFLFGLECAVAFGAVAVGLLSLLCAFVILPRQSLRVYALAIAVMSSPIGWVLTEPMEPDPRPLIDRDLNARARAARREIDRLIDSDPAYRELKAWTSVLKYDVMVRIDGSLTHQAVFDVFRARLVSECPVVKSSYIYWEMVVNFPTPKRVSGPDFELFGYDREWKPVGVARGR